MPFKDKRQIAIICLTGLLIIGFVMFRYLPLHKRAKSAKAELAAAKSVISQGTIEGEQLGRLKEQLSELQGLTGGYESKIPLEQGLGEFLQRIAQLMKEHDLGEQQIQPGNEVEVDGLSCIPITMHCKGRTRQIFEFYKSLQGIGRLVRIEHIELANGNNFSGEVSMQTQAVIYYEKGRRS